jgi:hypothetical protein
MEGRTKYLIPAAASVLFIACASGEALDGPPPGSDEPTVGVAGERRPAQTAKAPFPFAPLDDGEDDIIEDILPDGGTGDAGDTLTTFGEGEPSSEVEDAGAGVVDAGASAPDHGGVVVDAGAAVKDAGTTITDAGATVKDAGVNPRLWPNGVVPYTIDSAVDAPSRITDAIAHWHAKTAIRLVPRTNEKAYVTFTTGTGCSSYIGRQGIQQFVRLGSDCTVVAIIHEIGHTVGLYHEQCRADRDQYVRILTDNVDPEKLKNFDKQVDYKVGTYDYDSVMHYWSYSFSRNGLPTMVMIDGGLIPGGQTGLAPSDIRDIALLYEDVL